MFLTWKNQEHFKQKNRRPPTPEHPPHLALRLLTRASSDGEIRHRRPAPSRAKIVACGFRLNFSVTQSLMICVRS